MKIDKIVRPAVPETSRLDNASTKAATDNTRSNKNSLTQSRELDFAKAGQAALENLAMPESDKVAALKQAISSGNFDIDTEGLATDLAHHFIRED